MAWQAINRNTPVEAPDGPVLSDRLKDRIRAFFPRYETKRAALLPALHVTQNALGHVGLQAMVEIAELLELRPSEVLDTVGFYTHFWTMPKGRKTIVCCRSISCSVLGAEGVLQAFKEALGIDEHGTTPDGEYSLMTEECLAGCDHAPCVLINEKLHKRVKPEDVPGLLADAGNSKLDTPRSDLYDAPGPTEPAGSDAGTSGEGPPGASPGTTRG